LFRYAKIGENGGYSIDKMLWKDLTGKNVLFKTNLFLTEVPFYRQDNKGVLAL